MAWCLHKDLARHPRQAKEGKFLTFTEFKKKYIITTKFLCYIGLCNVIPKHWRKTFSLDNENDSVVTEHESVQPFKNLPPTCRQAHASYVYLSLSKNLYQKVRPIDTGFTDQTIAALYVLPFKVTNNIKLSKINHHILYTHDKLFKARLTDSDTCHVCKSKQTLKHLL